MSIEKSTELGLRLKRAREIIGISRDGFGKRVKVSGAYIGLLESGKRENPSSLFLDNACREFKLNPVWLQSGQGKMFLAESRAVTEDEVFDLNTPTERVEATPHGYVQIPLYDVQASAGGGALVESELVVDFMLFKDEWVRKVLRTTPKNLALIGVTGDSMESTLSDGDVVLVDTANRTLAINAIYVLNFCGALQVKRIQRRLDGSAVVISDNSVYGPETVSAEKVEQLQVVGRVVWYGRKG